MYNNEVCWTRFFVKRLLDEWKLLAHDMALNFMQMGHIFFFLSQFVGYFSSGGSYTIFFFFFELRLYCR